MVEPTQAEIRVYDEPDREVNVPFKVAQRGICLSEGIEDVIYNNVLKKIETPLNAQFSSHGPVLTSCSLLPWVPSLLA